MFEQENAGFHRERLIRRTEARYRNLAFPIYVFAPAAAGLIGEWRNVNGEPISYSIQHLDAEREHPTFRVETSIPGFDFETWTSSEELVEHPRPHPGSVRPLRSTPITVELDGLDVPATSEKYREGWTIRVADAQHEVTIRGDGDPPGPVALVKTMDMRPFIEEFHAFLERTPR